MAVVAPAAHATLLLAGNINGTNFCAADQNVGCVFGMVIPDGDPDLNQLGIATITIAGVQVFNSQHIATYGPPTNILNSSSLQIINTNNVAVDILVTVSATDFLPASVTAFVSGSGTFQNVAGSMIELSGGTTRPISKVLKTQTTRPETCSTFSVSSPQLRRSPLPITAGRSTSQIYCLTP